MLTKYCRLEYAICVVVVVDDVDDILMTYSKSAHKTCLSLTFSLHNRDGHEDDVHTHTNALRTRYR
jgi:hypothetical protein